MVWHEEMFKRDIDRLAREARGVRAAEADKVAAAAARGRDLPGKEWAGGDGLQIPTPNGSFTYNPHWVALHKAAEAVDKFGQSFGIAGPSSRVRVRQSNNYWLPGMEPQAAKAARRTRSPRSPTSRTVPMITFAERAELYARQVVAGEILAGRWVKAACQRHLDDLERSANDPSWPYRFDEERAARPCAFLECLPHVEGDWAKPVSSTARPTYPKIRPRGLAGLLRRRAVRLDAPRHRPAALPPRLPRGGAQEREEHARRRPRALHAGADGEEGAQVWSAATKKDQAKIVWSIAQRMVQREPDFRALGVRFTKRAIFQEGTGSKYEPLGRDSDTQDGLSSSCFISDELHAQKDRGLYDVLDSSTGARSQALGLGITTAGTNTAGVCYEQRTYLRGSSTSRCAGTAAWASASRAASTRTRPTSA
jgi:hypothetical protein